MNVFVNDSLLDDIYWLQHEVELNLVEKRALKLPAFNIQSANVVRSGLFGQYLNFHDLDIYLVSRLSPPCLEWFLSDP